MIRLFLAPEKLVSQRIMITGDQARHLALVLRAQPGDAVTLLDGSGYKYDCTLLTVQKREVRAEVIRKSPYSAESPVNIILAQGMPKAEKMDFIIQKSTELGVSAIIPVITERSQVRHTEKIERWRKIALSASQQSGREKIPEITQPLSFREFVSLPSPHFDKAGICGLSAGNRRGIILSEEEKERTLRKVIQDFKEERLVTLLAGPEGGFTGAELNEAVHKGFISVSLGPRILRTETTPLTAISIIQYEVGDIG